MRTWKSGRLILNTRELTEQIHLPTLSLSASSHFYSLPSSPSLSHLSPLSLALSIFPSPPTTPISSKSSYISSSSSSRPFPFPPHSPKKLDLNEQMKRGAAPVPSGGVSGKAGSALPGPVCLLRTPRCEAVRLSFFFALFPLLSKVRGRFIWGRGGMGVVVFLLSDRQRA